MIDDGGSGFDWVFMGFHWGGLWLWRSVWLWKSVWPWVLDFGFGIHVYRFCWRWLGFFGFSWGGWFVMEVEIGVAMEIGVAVGKMGFCHKE